MRFREHAAVICLILLVLSSTIWAVATATVLGTPHLLLLGCLTTVCLGYGVSIGYANRFPPIIQVLLVTLCITVSLIIIALFVGRQFSLERLRQTPLFLAASLSGGFSGVIQLAMHVDVNRIFRNGAWRWTAGYSLLCGTATGIAWCVTQEWKVAIELGAAYPFLLGVVLPSVLFAKLTSVTFPSGGNMAGDVENFYANVTWLFKKQIIQCNARSLFELSRDLHYLEVDVLLDTLNRMLAIRQFWQNSEERNRVKQQLAEKRAEVNSGREREDVYSTSELVEMILRHGFAEEIREQFPRTPPVTGELDCLSTKQLREIVESLPWPPEAIDERDLTLEMESLADNNEELRRGQLFFFLEKYCSGELLKQVREGYLKIDSH